LADDLLLVRELAASDRKLVCAWPDSWSYAAERSVAQGRLADVLQLEFLRQAHAARHVVRQAQLERPRVLRRPVLLVLLQQLEQRLVARQLALVRAEQPEQSVRQPAPVSRARRVLAQRRRARHASLLLRQRPSRLYLRWRRLRRQLRLALIVGNAS
jgi:hypothetical protein